MHISSRLTLLWPGVINPWSTWSTEFDSLRNGNIIRLFLRRSGFPSPEKRDDAVRRLGCVLVNNHTVIEFCYQSCINEGLRYVFTDSASHLCVLWNLPTLSSCKMNSTPSPITPPPNPLALLPNPATPMAFLPPDVAIQFTISSYVLIALTTASNCPMRTRHRHQY